MGEGLLALTDSASATTGTKNGEREGGRGQRTGDLESSTCFKLKRKASPHARLTPGLDPKIF